MGCWERWEWIAACLGKHPRVGEARVPIRVAGHTPHPICHTEVCMARCRLLAARLATTKKRHVIKMQRPVTVKEETGMFVIKKRKTAIHRCPSAGR